MLSLRSSILLIKSSCVPTTMDFPLPFNKLTSGFFEYERKSLATSRNALIKVHDISS